MSLLSLLVCIIYCLPDVARCGIPRVGGKIIETDIAPLSTDFAEATRLSSYGGRKSCSITNMSNVKVEATKNRPFPSNESLINALRDELNQMRNFQWSFGEEISEARLDQFSKNIQILKKVNDIITFFDTNSIHAELDVQVSKEHLDLLGSFFPQSPKVSDINNSQFSNEPGKRKIDKLSETVVDLTISELKQVLKDDILLEKANIYHAILLHQTGLNMVDSLMKTGYVNLQSIRRMFRDHKVVENVTGYVCVRFRIDCKQSDRITVAGSPYITEHWYWSIWHDCLKVLNKNEKEEKIINTIFLKTQLRSFLEVGPKNYITSPTWKSFMEFLESDSFWSNFELSDEAKEASNFQGEITKNDASIDANTKRIIDQFLMKDDRDQVNYAHKKQVEYLLVEILDLIERYISPEVIQKISSKHLRGQEFSERYNTLRLALKISDLRQKSGSFQYFLSKFKVSAHESTEAISVIDHKQLNDLVRRFNPGFGSSNG